MYQPINNHLCAAGSSLTPALIQKAIVLSGLTWGMSPAQYCAMQMWGLIDPVVVVSEVKEDSALHELSLKKNNDTLLGLPLELDSTLPKSVVQLRYQGAVMFEIQQLAIPSHFDD